MQPYDFVFGFYEGNSYPPLTLRILKATRGNSVLAYFPNWLFQQRGNKTQLPPAPVMPTQSQRSQPFHLRSVPRRNLRLPPQPAPSAALPCQVSLGWGAWHPLFSPPSSDPHAAGPGLASPDCELGYVVLLVSLLEACGQSRVSDPLAAEPTRERTVSCWYKDIVLSKRQDYTLAGDVSHPEGAMESQFCLKGCLMLHQRKGLVVMVVLPSVPLNTRCSCYENQRCFWVHLALGGKGTPECQHNQNLYLSACGITAYKTIHLPC